MEVTIRKLDVAMQSENDAFQPCPWGDIRSSGTQMQESNLSTRKRA